MKLPTSLDGLQAALAAAASKSPLDIDLIQAISSEIARLDPDNVRFTTDAGIISRLGQELVGKQETAVAELIKNAYDADATDMRLVFADTDAPGGTLLIEDNGSGMDRDQLIAGFMRLSSGSKVDHPVSDLFGRKRAGRKGIGRFAVQRLGESLVLTTQTEDADQALQITIDWNAFQLGADLSRIASKIEEVPKERPQGTTLFIRQLRESWSEAEQRRVYRYVSDLLQPFPLKPLPKSGKLVEGTLLERPPTTDHGFNVTLIRQLGDKEQIIASQEETLFSNALAVIEGYVDQKGEGVWTAESELLNIYDEIAPIGRTRETHEPFASLRNVSIRAYYYIWTKEFLPGQLFNTLSEIGRQRGGIRLFRNGFRVSPFGDRGDDWLELDASYGSRRFLPPHANSNFLGFVELKDSDNLFEEKTSREGLIENEAFRELKSFVYQTLIAGVLRVAEARGRKEMARQTKWQKNIETDPSDELKQKTSDLREVVWQARKNKYSNQESSTSKAQESQVIDKLVQEDEFTPIENLSYEIDATVETVKENQKQLIQENEMLRVLASLGIVIAEFTHEIRHTLDASKKNTQKLAKDITADSPHYKPIIDLVANLQRLRTYAQYFDRTVIDNAQREVQPQELRTVTRHFVEALEKATKRNGVELIWEGNGYDLYTPPMHTSEISSLLFNFYSNALKAIDRARTKGETAKGKMLVRVGLDNERAFIEFCDNGDGVPKEYEDRIFNAFFTTATPASRDSSLEQEAQGSGLGLKIVRDIVTAHSGEVYLTSPPSEYATCFRVEFPIHPAPNE